MGSFRDFVEGRFLAKPVTTTTGLVKQDLKAVLPPKTHISGSGIHPARPVHPMLAASRPKWRNSLL